MNLAKKLAAVVSGKRSVLEEHAADALEIDARVQRHAPSVRRVRDMAESLSTDALDAAQFVVSRRKPTPGHPDGQLILLDGQTRQAALAHVGVPDYPVRCAVFDGLKLEEEAAIFRILNNTKQPTALDDFLVGLTQGDEECVAINRIVESAGLQINRQSRDGFVTCVSRLREVHRMGGANALAPAVRIPIAAWGPVAVAADGHMIAGFGEFFQRFGPEVDREALIRKLAKYPGGPAGLLGSAKGMKSMKVSGVTVARCIAELVREIYNSGRKTQLPPL